MRDLGIINFLVSPGLGNPTLLPLLVHMHLPWLHWLALVPAELFGESTNLAHLPFRYVNLLYLDIFGILIRSIVVHKNCSPASYKSFFHQKWGALRNVFVPRAFRFSYNVVMVCRISRNRRSILRLSVAQNRKIANVKAAVAHCNRILSANRRLNVSGRTCQLAVASLLISLGWYLVISYPA
jgi:hypothetical protein